MKRKIFVGLIALIFSAAAFAYEPTASAPKKECCCEKGEDGKMACCKDKAKGTEKSGHEGHDMKGIDHK